MDLTIGVEIRIGTHGYIASLRLVDNFQCNLVPLWQNMSVLAFDLSSQWIICFILKLFFINHGTFLVQNLGMMAYIAILVYTAYDPSYTTTPQKCYLLSSFINLTVHFTVIKTNSYFWPIVMIKGYVWKIITIKTNYCAIDKILFNAKYILLQDKHQWPNMYKFRK